MHTLTLKIKKDIELQRGINVKQNPGKFSHLKNELITSVWTLKTNIADHHNFCRFANL
jgi:hypothetical protein